MQNGMEVVDQLLDEEIRQITELRRMARVPRLLDVMRMIVKVSDSNQGTTAASASVAPPTPKSSTPSGTEPQDSRRSSERAKPIANGLTAATKQTVRTLNRPFSIPETVKTMQESGFKFVAAKPKVAVAGVFKQMLKNGELKIIKNGTGSDPNLYEYINQEELRLS